MGNRKVQREKNISRPDNTNEGDYYAYLEDQVYEPSEDYNILE